MLFGKIAVNHHYITNEQLEKALKIQESEKNMGYVWKIGEIGRASCRERV